MTVDKIGVTLTDQHVQTMVLERPPPVLGARLDVEAQPQTPQCYGIHTLPTVLVFQAGQVVDARIGVVDGADLAATLHALTGIRQA